MLEKLTEVHERYLERIRIKKGDSTFFADFLFGVLADREDCKSTMNTTFWLGNLFLPFLLSSDEVPGCPTAFQPSFYLLLPLRVHRLYSSWLRLTTGYFVTHKWEKGNLTWTDSFFRNRCCQTSSDAAPPLGHRKSGCPDSQHWFNGIKGIDKQRSE